FAGHNVNVNGTFSGAMVTMQALGNMTVQGQINATISADDPNNNEIDLFAAGTFASNVGLNSTFDVRIQGLLSASVNGGGSPVKRILAGGNVTIESDGLVTLTEEIGDF